MIRTFNKVAPVIASDVFIAETASVIGDVHIGPMSSVWYNVVIRGDVNQIRIGCRTNIQDLTLLHVTGRKNEHNSGFPLTIGDDVTIGHNVTLHGCTIENNAFIGMNAMVMDGAVVGSGAIVAAGSLVAEGTVIEPGTLWMGAPAKFKKNLSESDFLKFNEISKAYIKLAAVYLAELSSE